MTFILSENKTSGFYLLGELWNTALWREDKIQVASASLWLEIDLFGRGQREDIGQLLEDRAEGRNDHGEGKRGRAVIDHRDGALD